jgi:type IV pilus assembly protein PilQ
MNSKSLASWLLVATLCPQALVVPSVHAQASQANMQAAVPSVPAPLPEAASRITDVTAEVSGNRLNLGVNFASSDRPQISYTRQGKTWVAILNGAKLQLKGGNASFAKANLSPDVIGVEAIQSGVNQVQIRVTTAAEISPKDALNRADIPGGVMFSVNLPTTTVAQGNVAQGGTDKANTARASVPPQPRPNTAAPNITAQNSGSPNPTSPTSETANSSGVLRQQATTGTSSTLSSAGMFQPQITITSPDGKSRVAQTTNASPSPASTSGNSTVPPINNPTVPQLPGRVPGVTPPFRPLTTPPVGDIATTTNRIQSETVNLGTSERVPRITLRDAPAIEVLTLIARIANLSVVSAESSSAAGGAGAAPAAGATGGATGIRQPVSLDVENEPAQDVFNNILRITGLESNRIGNTIFVASRLPVTLRNLITKSYRLNQITAGEASAYLIGLGASRVVNRQRPIPGAQTATIGSAAATVVNVPTESVPTLETVAISAESGASPLLKGLQVIAEERGNSITLVGTPKQIEFAEAQIARLDSRKRQVAVNVKVMEVQLSDNQTFNSDISLVTPGGTVSSTVSNGGNFFLDFATPPVGGGGTQRLTLGLSAALDTSRGKILTDPTLTVQEGEEAKISLTQDVATEITFTTVAVTLNGVAQTLPAQQIKREEAGLALNIRILRVDDNGFVTLSVSPDIKAPGAQVPLGTIQGIATSYTPLSKRTLNSGQIRLRDGQTLIISGVIRDSDRQSTTKVPILGDIPILGALFRSDQSINERSEVVIIVTPRIIDDSQNATWGYTYQPNPETQRVLDSNGQRVQ